MPRTNDWMLKEDRNLLVARQGEWRGRWEKARSRGKLRFILVRYVLFLGGTLASLEALLHLDLFHGVHAAYAYWGIALTILASCLMGLWEWHSNEKRYRRG